MPKVFKNVDRRDLNRDERSDFESLGFSDKDIDKINGLLKAERWLFWAKASELFITLAGGEEMHLKNGKPVIKELSESLKFTSNYATVTDRAKALLVFQSDAYREGRVKLSADQLRDEQEAKYKQFKDEVLRDPAMVERVRRELAEQALPKAATA